MEMMLRRPPVPEETSGDKDTSEKDNWKPEFGLGNTTVGSSKALKKVLHERSPNTKTNEETNSGTNVVETGNTWRFVIISLEESWEGDEHEIEETINKSHEEPEHQEHWVHNQELEGTENRNLEDSAGILGSLENSVQMRVPSFGSEPLCLPVEKNNTICLSAVKDETSCHSNSNEDGEDPEDPSPLQVLNNETGNDWSSNRSDEGTKSVDCGCTSKLHGSPDVG